MRGAPRRLAIGSLPLRSCLRRSIYAVALLVDMSENGPLWRDLARVERGCKEPERLAFDSGNRGERCKGIEQLAKLEWNCCAVTTPQKS